MSARMPSFYVPHGAGPCFFMDWNPPDLWHPMGTFLAGLAGTLPEQPRAIVLVSGHWEASEFTTGAASRPALIYDYFGFPPHTYELTYPAAGDPALAARIGSLLAGVGLGTMTDPERGLDHGVFIPLKLMFPAADIPIVPLSLRADYDAGAHLAAGKALAPLRDEGVLIVGSGMSFHNMAGFRDPEFMKLAPDYASQFSDWLNLTIAAPAPIREAALAQWTQGPAARLAHPQRAEEHLLPLMVAAGAADTDPGRCIFDHAAMGLRVTGYQFG